MIPRLVLALVAVALLIAALLWWRPQDEPPPEPAPQPAATPAAPSSLGSLQPGELPPDALHVEVSLRLLQPFIPPLPFPVEASTPDGRRGLPVQIVAGLGAPPFGGTAADGLSLLWVEVEENLRLLRRAVREAGAPVQVKIGPRRLLYGQVLGPDGPLADARIWLGEASADGELRLGYSDAEGRFELDAPLGEGMPLVVQCAGFAAQGRFLSLQPGAEPLQVQLRPAEPLRVGLAGSGSALLDAQVFVRPPPQVSSELTDYPFFLQAVTGGTAVNALGRAEILDLPAGVDVQVQVVMPGQPIAAPLTVAAKARREPLLVQVTVGEVQQVLVEPAAADGTAAALFLLPSGHGGGPRPSSRLLPSWLDLPGLVHSTADLAGNARLPRILPAGSRLLLRAPRHAGIDLAAASILAAQPIRLPQWDYSTEPGLVLLPPVAAAVWSSSCSWLAEGRVVHAADEPLQVAVPEPGRYAVSLRWQGGGLAAGSHEWPELSIAGRVEIAVPR